MGRPKSSSKGPACTIAILLLIAGAVDAAEDAQAPRDEAPQEEAELDAAVPEGYRLCPDAFVPCKCSSHQSHGAHRGYETQEPHTSAELSFTRHGGKRFCCCPGGSAQDPCSTGGVTEVLGFDDIPAANVSLPVPADYSNFIWSSSAFVINGPLEYPACQSGHTNGAVSQPNVLFGDSGLPIAMSAPAGVEFTVTSLEATAAWQNNVQATFTGFDGQGRQIGQVQATVNITGPATVNLTSLGCISTLTMVAACGVDAPGACFDNQCIGVRTFLAIDNIAVTRYNAPSARNTWRPATLPTDNILSGRDAANGMLTPGHLSPSKLDAPRTDLPTKLDSPHLGV